MPGLLGSLSALAEKVRQDSKDVTAEPDSCTRAVLLEFTSRRTENETGVPLSAYASKTRSVASTAVKNFV
jgi:hypothetical protein